MSDRNTTLCVAVGNCWRERKIRDLRSGNDFTPQPKDCRLAITFVLCFVMDRRVFRSPEVSICKVGCDRSMVEANALAVRAFRFSDSKSSPPSRVGKDGPPVMA